LLAKTALATGAALAAGATVAFVAWTLVPPPSPVRTIPISNPHARSFPAGKTSPRRLPTTDLVSIPPGHRDSDRGQPPAPDDHRENLVVEHPQYRLTEFGKRVDQAIGAGVQFLVSQQLANGSWRDSESDAKTGVTSLVTLALIRAGEKPDSPAVGKALGFLRGFGPGDLHSTYAISLQTQVFAAALPESDRSRIAANVMWLERAQIRPGDGMGQSGSWSYSDAKHTRPGDNSNTHYALAGLFAAAGAGVPVKPAIWKFARAYWARTQRRDGSWAYTPNSNNPTASMTCAGVSSLIISGPRRFEGGEFLDGAAIRNCGTEAVDKSRHAGVDWLANHFRLDQNFGAGQQWRFYFLDELQRAARLAGLRYFGQNDWYRLGALALVDEQSKPGGFWTGALMEQDKLLATSFALLFLSNGRTPVMINKLRHAPLDDWDNDPDDVRNLVSVVAREWKYPLTWQIADSQTATVLDLLQAPILFMSGHRAPSFTATEKQKLREYAERGGVIFAEACCASAEFDAGFRKMMQELLPAKEDELRPLPDDHPVWRATHRLSSTTHPLLSINRGARILVIYSPTDLSCYWNLSQKSPADPAVIAAIQIGQNVIEHVTDRKVPPDKLSER
jgi:hypothetical protein